MSASPTPSITWRHTRQLLAEDSVRVRASLRSRFGVEPWTLFFDASFRCVFLHRVAHFFWCRGAKKLARLFMQINSVVTGADIHPNCSFGGGLLIPNPVAIMASGNAGRNLTLMPLSGIGILPRGNDVGAGAGLPVLGDDVWLGTGSGVLGPVVVGSRTRLQPGASLTHDVAPDSIVEVAARQCEQEPLKAASRSTCRVHSKSGCSHNNWSLFWRDFDQDILRYLAMRQVSGNMAPGLARKMSAACTTEVLGIALHRIAHFLYCSGWPRLAMFVCQTNLLVFRLTINPASCLGGGLFLPHPAGTVVNATVGRDATMYARSICAPHSPALIMNLEGGPILGDRVLLGGMAAVLGTSEVGDDVNIGFNVQVESDLPGGQLVASSSMMTRVVRHVAVESDRPIFTKGLPSRIDYVRVWTMFREDRLRIREVHSGEMPWLVCVCALLFRHSRFFLGRGHRRLARAFWRLNLRLTGADIDPRSDIGGGLTIPHPAGIAIHVTAGRNLTLWALAGVGPEHAWDPFKNDPESRPLLGDGVVICEHAALYGPVQVGDDVIIGAGCKVTWDVPARTEVRTQPVRARGLRRTGASIS